MSNKSIPVQVRPEDSQVILEWEHESRMLSCRFDPLGRYVFTTAFDYTVQRWELESGNKTIFKGHDSWVRGLAFSSDGETLLTGGYDGRLIWWSVDGEECEPWRTLDAHDGWVRALSVKHDGSLIVTGGNDQLVKVWRMDTGELVHAIAGHDRHIYSVHFHPNGESMFSGDLRGVIKQWNVADGREIATYDAKELYTENPGQNAEYGGVRSMDFAATQNQLVCSGLYKAPNPFAGKQQPLVMVFDGETHESLHKHVAADELTCIAWRAVFHPAGFILGACGGGSGGFLLFWKPDSETEFHRFKLPDTLHGMDLHPNGMLVATTHYDRHVRITRLAGDKATAVS